MIKSDNFEIGEYNEGTFYLYGGDGLMDIENKAELIELIELLKKFLASK